jgi:hypothetical protein
MPRALNLVAQEVIEKATRLGSASDKVMRDKPSSYEEKAQEILASDAGHEGSDPPVGFFVLEERALPINRRRSYQKKNVRESLPPYDNVSHLEDRAILNPCSLRMGCLRQL